MACRLLSRGSDAPRGNCLPRQGGTAGAASAGSPQEETVVHNEAGKALGAGTDAPGGLGARPAVGKASVVLWAKGGEQGREGGSRLPSYAAPPCPQAGTGAS